MLRIPTIAVSEYRLQPVWPTPTAAVQQEVVRCWLTEGALPDRTTAEARAPQLLVVARDPTGEIAGVSTAIRAFVPQLGFECFFYRTFVGRAHRVQGLQSRQLGKQILQHSHRLLNERFQQGIDPEVLGIYLEIENPVVMHVRNDAVWQDDGMNAVYVGRTSDGRHMRIWYFDGARVPSGHVTATQRDQYTMQGVNAPRKIKEGQPCFLYTVHNQPLVRRRKVRDVATICVLGRSRIDGCWPW